MKPVHARDPFDDVAREPRAYAGAVRDRSIISPFEMPSVHEKCQRSNRNVATLHEHVLLAVDVCDADDSKPCASFVASRTMGLHQELDEAALLFQLKVRSCVFDSSA